MTYLVNRHSPGWHPIPGHPRHEANLTTGEIRNRRTARLIKQTVTLCGARCYMTCHLGRVHRLLIAALVGRELRRNELVCHVNGNPLDNRLDNLRLDTPKANSLDKIRHNTNGRTLRNADVHEIRALLGTKPCGWIAERYGITRRHVYFIAAGERWANLPC